MRLLYFAHPYGGKPENLVDAKRRLRQAIEEFSHDVVIAPWIPVCEVFDDADESTRRLHLDHDLFVVSQCSGIILAGPYVSPGMSEERTQAEDLGLAVFNRIGIYQ